MKRMSQSVGLIGLWLMLLCATGCALFDSWSTPVFCLSLHREVRRNAFAPDTALIQPVYDVMGHSRSRFVLHHAACMVLAGWHFAFRYDVFRDVNGFGIAVAKGLQHLKFLEENIIQLTEGDFSTSGDDRFHGIDSENLLDGFVELLAEQLQILFRQRKSRRHGVAAETDQRIGADTKKIDQI